MTLRKVEAVLTSLPPAITIELTKPLERAAESAEVVVDAHGINCLGDLLRLLMTHDWIGKLRVESARRRPVELNPRTEIVAVQENLDVDSADARDPAWRFLEIQYFPSQGVSHW